MKWGIVFGLLVLGLVSCSSELAPLTIETDTDTFHITVEIAQTKEERMQGLMHRESLGRDNGMLFIMNDEVVQTFWMKNTLIPLDMIFINNDKEIVTIHHAVPCEADPCPVYRSSHPAKYVLEVNGGYTLKNGIGVGDKVSFNLE